MSTLFTRMKDSISADMHNLLDKKESKNPITALNQYLRQSEQETEKVRNLVDRQYRLKEEFTREHQEAVEMAEKRKQQAEVAARAGEDELHNFAIQELEEYNARAERLNRSREDAVDQLENLERKYEEMKHKLKDMRLKRMELMGRENVAKAHHQMNRMTEETGETSYSRFSDMERYIEGLEHQVTSSYYHNAFDSKIAQLENKLQEKENLRAE
ncbi:PspA/IM30 family protein [Alteribacter populi]|uniref:PspA/IM30 family protein n=1 Tax=Alteribacter populi TaxID=2011011 RepID=UPI000BBB5848|nr:PspA/IM30 family protein [Alteribacter populi]